MDGEHLYTIGELARRTGLAVKTIRFYSDSGVVPPTDRSPAGYRLYDLDALVRLDLVRTLRELGFDLAAIRRVLDRRVSVPEIAAVHADALDAQIRTLRTRRAVLRAVAERGSDPELTEQVREHVESARASGIDPASDRARTVLDGIIARSCAAFGETDSPEYRAALLTRVETANDPRTERCFQLLGIMNGWPPIPTLVPVFDWFVQSLRHHPVP
ncbi:MerR family transcriptional regulator [Actinocorallia libanotica]